MRRGTEREIQSRRESRATEIGIVLNDGAFRGARCHVKRRHKSMGVVAGTFKKQQLQHSSPTPSTSRRGALPRGLLPGPLGPRKALFPIQTHPFAQPAAQTASLQHDPLQTFFYQYE